MAGSSSEGEVNHWPAFVDVLTTVIMVVSFLLVIMSAAVMVLSQRKMEQFKQQLMAKQAAAAAQKDGKAQGHGGRAAQSATTPIDAPDGSAQAEKGDILRSPDSVNGIERLTIRTRETKDTLAIQVKAVEQPKDTAGAEVKTADLLLTIAFEPTAVRIDDANSAKVTAFLKARPLPDATYEVWSFVPQTGSVSEAQRIAFYRAAITRNVLIRSGIAPGRILTQARLTDPADRMAHSVRVVVKP